MPAADKLTAEVVASVSLIPEQDWHACAGTGHPFLDRAFFLALEQSGCTNADSGWQPYHLVIRDKTTGAINAIMPLFLKGHSYGEYVFDHGWADAYQRAGGSYYPKLQSAIPFTPVTGPRLLARPGSEHLRTALLSAGCNACKELGVSSLHMTFMDEGEAKQAQNAGYLIRTDQQFHWHNDDYSSFDNFLSALSSRKRKQIKKERRRVLEQNVTFRHVSGDAISESDWDIFFTFYTDTGHRKWGTPYLNREFFSLIGQSMADRILLILCEHEGKTIAGALNFIGCDTLYGRYWGCTEMFDNLHFETCYYQAMDYAIARGIKHVEAGAQGPHKLARGYQPQKTYSAHWIPNPGFREAVARFLEVERREIDAEIDYLGAHVPFKKS
ncbi:GNAT family N-acetyltransferase [Kordiimonas aestuarii]|uniref:GNAT family N-acetyltransferase n=1 Tax=Kordiimonas aestuarii TaxID=1005925 RepID=UPI0021CF9E4F|nr:GNAT family N-acetyltransferase [Kordiimonas aestuarii]